MNESVNKLPLPSYMPTHLKHNSISHLDLDNLLTSDIKQKKDEPFWIPKHDKIYSNIKNY